MNSKPSIDSVFIQIPISQVTLQDTLLGQRIAEVSLTSGQIADGERFKTQHYHKENGINTEFSKGLSTEVSNLETTLNRCSKLK